MQGSLKSSENQVVPATRAHTSLPGRLPTFTVACWLLALLGFAQLVTLGTALALRKGPAPEPAAAPELQASSPAAPLQPRSLEDILASVDQSPTPTTVIDQQGAAPPLNISAAPPSATPPLVVYHEDKPDLPAISDPVVERLVRESRALQIEGDMMRAILKLEEAARIDQAEPAVIYHKALLFEEMGDTIKAADHYQQVQQMGIKAGVYFKLAADKLTKGMDVAHAKRPAISIGPMKTRKGSGPAAGKKADVTITVLARPDKQINPADVDVQVHFYDILNEGEIRKASSIATIDYKWQDSQTDWLDTGNEETLDISYRIPEADLADEYLLGRREFFGYVVELFYKGELIDQQAQPRRLHSVHSRISGTPFPAGTLPWLPGDDHTLLPGKVEHDYGNNPTLPPLPRR